MHTHVTPTEAAKNDARPSLFGAVTCARDDNLRRRAHLLHIFLRPSVARPLVGRVVGISARCLHTSRAPPKTRLLLGDSSDGTLLGDAKCALIKPALRRSSPTSCKRAPAVCSERLRESPQSRSAKDFGSTISSQRRERERKRSHVWLEPLDERRRWLARGQTFRRSLGRARSRLGSRPSLLHRIHSELRPPRCLLLLFLFFQATFDLSAKQAEGARSSF